MTHHPVACKTPSQARYQAAPQPASLSPLGFLALRSLLPSPGYATVYAPRVKDWHRVADGSAVDRLMTAEELAETLGVSVRTVRRLTATRAIPFYRIGGAVRFRPAEVAEWLEAQRFEPFEAASAERWSHDKVGVVVVPVVLLLAILWLTGALPSWWPSLPLPSAPLSPFGG